jgi:hypothetical protein
MMASMNVLSTGCEISKCNGWNVEREAMKLEEKEEEKNYQ